MTFYNLLSMDGLHITIKTIDLTTVLQPGNLVAWLLVGLIAGYLASSLVRGRGYGCLGNVVVGLIGSFIGGILASALDAGANFRFCGSIFISFIGALIFVTCLQLLRGASRS